MLKRMSDSRHIESPAAYSLSAKILTKMPKDECSDFVRKEWLPLAWSIRCWGADARLTEATTARVVNISCYVREITQAAVLIARLKKHFAECELSHYEVNGINGPEAEATGPRYDLFSPVFKTHTGIDVAPNLPIMTTPPAMGRAAWVLKKQRQIQRTLAKVGL